MRDSGAAAVQLLLWGACIDMVSTDAGGGTYDWRSSSASVSGKRMVLIGLVKQ